MFGMLGGLVHVFNVASIASVLLMSEALVAEIPEEKPPAPAGPPGGDMY